MSDEKTNDIEVRMLNAMRKTLISVAKDTMTKPGLRHPLTENTQKNDYRLFESSHLSSN